MAVDTGILGLDLATFGIGSAPSKISLKVADEIAETAAKKTSKKKSVKKNFYYLTTVMNRIIEIRECIVHC